MVLVVVSNRAKGRHTVSVFDVMGVVVGDEALVYSSVDLSIIRVGVPVTPVVASGETQSMEEEALKSLSSSPSKKLNSVSALSGQLSPVSAL